MADRKLDFLAMLRALLQHDVDFIVVGGVAAALNGAPLTTFDLDVVHSREAGNVERLLAALEDLGARSRLHGGSEVKPDRSHLSSAGHHLLMTRAGALDLLGAIGKGKGFGELLGHSSLVEVAPGIMVRILQLEALIQVKEETGGDKDNAALPILRATLAERRRLQ